MAISASTLRKWSQNSPDLLNHKLAERSRTRFAHLEIGLFAGSEAHLQSSVRTKKQTSNAQRPTFNQEAQSLRKVAPRAAAGRRVTLPDHSRHEKVVAAFAAANAKPN